MGQEAWSSIGGLIGGRNRKGAESRMVGGTLGGGMEDGHQGEGWGRDGCVQQGPRRGWWPSGCQQLENILSMMGVACLQRRGWRRRKRSTFTTFNPFSQSLSVPSSSLSLVTLMDLSCFDLHNKKNSACVFKN